MSNRHNSILIRLADADMHNAPRLPVDLLLKSLFLRAWLRFNRLRAIGDLAPNHSPSPEVVPKWVVLREPSDVTFELACELPVYLPNRSDEWEFEVAIGGQQFIVCNRMQRCQLIESDNSVEPFTYILCHQQHLEGFKTEGRRLVYREPLKSVIMTSFTEHTASPRELFESAFPKWNSVLLAAGNALIDGIRMTLSDDLDANLNAYSRPVFLGSLRHFCRD